MVELHAPSLHDALPILALLVYQLLASVHILAALAFDVAVLYFTLGFRQFSHHFTEIQLAIKASDLDRARQLLEEDRKSTRLNSSHVKISYAVFCLKKKI